jgi:hypothetical protein
MPTAQVNSPTRDVKASVKNIGEMWERSYEGSDMRAEVHLKAERIAASGTGYLYKQGKHRKNWKERLVTVTNGKIQYSKDGSLRGHVDLSGDSVMVTIQPNGTEKTGSSAASEWRFEVSNGSQSLMLAAGSEEEMYAWVRHIQKVSGNGGSGTASMARQEQILSTQQGMLYKQGRNFKTWKERMFSLDEGKLQYKENEKTKGEIQLEGKVVTVKTISGTFQRQWTFRVDNGETHLVMAAKSEPEMFAWITAIELASGAVPTHVKVKVRQDYPPCTVNLHAFK